MEHGVVAEILAGIVANTRSSEHGRRRVLRTAIDNCHAFSRYQFI